jgi:hypothetical protein
MSKNPNTLRKSLAKNCVLLPLIKMAAQNWGFSNGNTFWEDSEPENTLSKLGWWTVDNDPQYP